MLIKSQEHGLRKMAEPTRCSNQDELTRFRQNPFMITSNMNYGINVLELKKVNDILNEEDHQRESSTEETAAIPTKAQEAEHGEERNYSDLSFLYTRESDRIGEYAELSQSPLAKQFRAKPPRRKKVKRAPEFAPQEEPSREAIAAVLDSYNHAPKPENPLYQTSANSIGSKKPSLATHTANRHPRTQAFSKSFNRKMFRDHGLNTARTKSNVLDNQFM
eukprot:14373_1